MISQDYSLPALNIYQIFRLFELRIAALELTVKSLVRQRDVWIRKSGPKEVRSQSFDLDRAGVTIYATEPEVIQKIADFTKEIEKNQLCIEAEESCFAEYKTKMRQTRKDLEEHGCPDTTLIVFDECFIKKKTNEQVAKDIGYSIKTVWNAKVTINKLMEGEVT